MSKARIASWFRGFTWSATLLCALTATAGRDSHPSTKAAIPDFVVPLRAAVTQPQAPPAPDAQIGAESCDDGLAEAARRNRDGLNQLTFAPFRRVENGWEVYEPLIAHEIGTHCSAATPAFARTLAAWQTAHGLSRTGVVDEVTFAPMKAKWDQRRPFEAASKQGCPLPPPETSLVLVPGNESYGGKVMLLRPAALAAYGRMLKAARAEVLEVKADPRLMTVFSAYRSHGSDTARCAQDSNCQGIVRATCSAHLTGLAIDLYLGAAPGYPPDSSDDVNRLYISRGAAYRWMVSNAARFGFVPYAFEPWHWEWTGEPV